MALFYQFRSRYREGAHVLAETAEMLERVEPIPTAQKALLLILAELGWFWIRLGPYEDAQATLHRAQALYAKLDIPPLPGQGTDPIGPLAFWR